MSWYTKIKKDKNIKLIVASISFSIVFSIMLHPMLKETVQSNEIINENFFLIFCLVIILAFFFSKLIGLIFSQHIIEEKIEEKIEKISVKKYVNEILDSKEFISALRTTLPKGEKDEEHGLDHIPFLLQNSNDKRERYSSISRFFLIATIISALIFSTVIIYFGYVLINDDSAGFYKALTELKDEVNQTNEAYLGISNTATLRIEEIGNTIDEIVLKSSNPEINLKLSALVDSINIENIDDVSSRLVEIDNLVSKNKSPNSALRPPTKKFDLSSEINVVIKKVQKIAKDYQVYGSRISNSLEDIKLIESKLEKMTIPDSYSLGEIFKRLFIGIIVTSFLLAILRFLTNQYKKNYEKTLIADEENSLIRRFYVAYKASQNDAERAIAITRLVEIRNLKEVTTESEVKALDNEMLKEIMSAIAKKL